MAYTVNSDKFVIKGTALKPDNFNRCLAPIPNICLKYASVIENKFLMFIAVIQLQEIISMH